MDYLHKPRFSIRGDLIIIQISHKTTIIKTPVILIICDHIHVFNLTLSSDASNVLSMLCHFVNRWYMNLMGQFVPNLTFCPERAADITAPTQTAPRNQLYLKVAAYVPFSHSSEEIRERENLTLTPRQSDEQREWHHLYPGHPLPP